MPSALPAYCHPAAFDAFRRELAGIDSPVGLLRAATAIALHAEPTLGIDPVVETVRRIAETVRGRLKSDSEEAAFAHLHDVLFDVLGYRGVASERYYEPANSYLPHVLETRRGIPITLTLVYRSVAAELGLRVEGVNAPGHFLAVATCREATGDRRRYVDPFFGGVLLNVEEAVARVESVTGQLAEEAQLAVATPGEWLGRMLINLQAIFARTQQERDLLAMQELESLLGRPA